MTLLRASDSHSSWLCEWAVSVHDSGFFNFSACRLPGSGSFPGSTVRHRVREEKDRVRIHVLRVRSLFPQPVMPAST